MKTPLVQRMENEKGNHGSVILAVTFKTRHPRMGFKQISSITVPKYEQLLISTIWLGEGGGVRWPQLSNFYSEVTFSQFGGGVGGGRVLGASDLWPRLGQQWFRVLCRNQNNFLMILVRLLVQGRGVECVSGDPARTEATADLLTG